MARLINKRILILCEGTTEYIYAKTLQASLPRERQRMLSVEIHQHKQNDPASLAKEAKKKSLKAQREKNPYNGIWLFFDNDNSPHLAEAFRICEEEEFSIAYSSISLEFWFILHFEDCGRVFANANACIRYLKLLWPTYHKTRVNHYALLKDAMPIARERAEHLYDRMSGERLLDRHPYTTVHQMIAFFEAL